MHALKDTNPMSSCQSKPWRIKMFVMNERFLLMRLSAVLRLSADLFLLNLMFVLSASVSLSMAPARPLAELLAWLGSTMNPGGGASGLAGVDMKPFGPKPLCVHGACMSRVWFAQNMSPLCVHDGVFGALMFSEHGDAVRACPNLIRMCV